MSMRLKKRTVVNTSDYIDTVEISEFGVERRNGRVVEGGGLENR